MTKTAPEDFTVVTPRNVRLIRGLLAAGQGHLLIAESGHESFGGRIVDLVMEWYDHPTLDLFRREWSVSTPRPTEMRGKTRWQTGWEHDRDWILRPVRRPGTDAGVELARSLFTKQRIGRGYEFKIGFLATAGRGLPLHTGIVIYVARTRGKLRKQRAESALFYALHHYMNAINGRRGLARRPFPGDEAARLASYAAQDLIDGKVFRGNVNAGEEADALCA